MTHQARLSRPSAGWISTGDWRSAPPRTIVRGAHVSVHTARALHSEGFPALPIGSHSTRLTAHGFSGYGAWPLLLALGAVIGCAPPHRAIAPAPRPTIAARVAQYGPAARARLRPYFAAAGVPYPPARFLLLGLKREHALQLYAAGPERPLAFIRSYAVLGASGELGPKLREGDYQVPEGIYRIVYLNPNSIAHLSLALSYPNAFDRMQADEDGRERAALGGDIMIHGGTGSVGCLAVGDTAAEELFVLAADSDWQDARVVISPVDFRRTALPVDERPPVDWVSQLYAWLDSEVRSLPLPPEGSAAESSAR